MWWKIEVDNTPMLVKKIVLSLLRYSLQGFNFYTEYSLRTGSPPSIKITLKRSFLSPFSSLFNHELVLLNAQYQDIYFQRIKMNFQYMTNEIFTSRPLTLQGCQFHNFGRGSFASSQQCNNESRDKKFELIHTKLGRVLLKPLDMGQPISQFGLALLTK